MKLNYRTKENSKPHGKPHVYFCAHPKDFLLYFDRIVSDIFETQNCVIYYKDEADREVEAQEIDLEQMQLFVTPITERLLRDTACECMKELVFAQKRHIPILPLMLEEELEEEFSRQFGDIQFLRMNNNEITAIPYSEKLRRFLSSVLIDDETAEKIRASFDAYVFLSYRKKDRAYAQELMRLIHKNEFCRDIAIWYDEFLVPGENFNETIATALKKSDLFAMVVTPNLVNEPNYVMSTEYPMARREKKHILSAEMVPTDKDMLKNAFSGIGAITDAHSDVELSESLLKAVQALAIKENDHSPQHNFFIGLAYLSGIDVEVDKERAVSLIKGSAEAGLVEAMEKLASMYEKEEGIEKDYVKALEWREKALSVYEKNYLASVGGQAEKENKLIYAEKLCVTADDYVCIDNMLEKASLYLQKAADLLEDEDEMTASDKILNIKSDIYDNMACICRLNHQYSKAESLYSKALKICERLYEITKSECAQRKKVRIYANLVYNLVMSGGANDGDLTMREKVVSEYEQLASDTGKIEDAQALMSIYSTFWFIGGSDRSVRNSRLNKAQEIANRLCQTKGYEINGAFGLISYHGMARLGCTKDENSFHRREEKRILDDLFTKQDKLKKTEQKQIAQEYVWLSLGDQSKVGTECLEKAIQIFSNISNDKYLIVDDELRLAAACEMLASRRKKENQLFQAMQLWMDAWLIWERIDPVKYKENIERAKKESNDCYLTMFGSD